MTSLPVFVGLDYHSQSVQVCILDEKGTVLANRSLSNDAAVIEQFVRRFGEPRCLALEACCGAAHLADELTDRSGWHVELAHPGYVARMKRGPDKTDHSDAWLLADLLRVGYLPVVWLASERIRGLRRLVRFRDQLVKDRRNVKLRIRALLREQRCRAPAELNAWTQRWFGWLGGVSFSEDDRWLVDQQLERIGELTQQIRDAESRLRQSTQHDVVVQKLMTFEGVGLITAATMRSEIGRFDRFENG